MPLVCHSLFRIQSDCVSIGKLAFFGFQNSSILQRTEQQRSDNAAEMQVGAASLEKRLKIHRLDGNLKRVHFASLKAAASDSLSATT